MKKIEDYLHLYLGCDGFLTNDDGEGGIKGVPCKLTYSILSGNYYGPQHFTPALRPLSSMTEEEAIELILAAEGAKAEFVEWHSGSEAKKERFGFMWKSDHYRKGQLHNTWYEQFEPEGTRYLLSKGFDLFGLIEAGLAIDATTIEHI